VVVHVSNTFEIFKEKLADFEVSRALKEIDDGRIEIVPVDHWNPEEIEKVVGIHRGRHENDFRLWCILGKKATNNDQQQVGIDVAFVDFVNDDVRVVVHRLFVDKTLQNDTSGTEKILVLLFSPRLSSSLFNPTWKPTSSPTQELRSSATR
jgi:hypothetical protein